MRRWLTFAGASLYLEDDGSVTFEPRGPDNQLPVLRYDEMNALYFAWNAHRLPDAPVIIETRQGQSLPTDEAPLVGWMLPGVYGALAADDAIGWQDDLAEPRKGGSNGDD